MTDLAEIVAGIVRAAAVEILAVKRRGFTLREKDDHSPVTDADEAANRLIVERLTALTPEIPIIAEESVADGSAPEASNRFWLVDPLDGTREFVAGRDEYTVNIALIEHARPALGVVGAPARGEIYAGGIDVSAVHYSGTGGHRPITARPAPEVGPVAVASRSHGSDETDAWLTQSGAARTVRVGSALKFCLVADGKADLYPRFGRTMEWDTAAGHAVLAAAGGSVRTLDGRELFYGKPGFENPHFVARGAPISA